MRLFIREHGSLIAFTLLQWVALLGLIWLAGFRSLRILGYVWLLGVVSFAAFLTLFYLRRRSMYRRLSQSLASMEEALVDHQPSTPAAEAFAQLLHDQYRMYQDRLHAYEQRQQRHLTFINQWVHQMKTPLSVADLLLQEEETLAVDSVREELDRLRAGLQMILYTSRLEAFEQDFRIESLPLSELVQQVIKENKRLFISKRVFPRLTLAPEAQVMSDAKWLGFVLQQLLTNAVRYSSGRSEHLHVSIQRAGGVWELTIKDEGVGIPPADLPRVFEPYYTGENGRKYKESTGMGLYLVREICRKLGHAVTLQSQVGVGTKVTITFGRRQPYTNVR
ncbi:signal transduction histidine kinase [Laceyella sediminis]|jgi:two-component system, OmpR family, sensor histidine kinase YxdK|uniref:histidine kinase n=1 Tax=Laceyella sediminis TaxID=573074 RepID=A0ABX5EMZ9_9BACL|nr:sensor histidine kinase [Laceyella sediminis]PRZ12271.1 signal transduction histidine kinase [Laceyella sediminis]